MVVIIPVVVELLVQMVVAEVEVEQMTVVLRLVGRVVREETEELVRGRVLPGHQEVEEELEAMVFPLPLGHQVTEDLELRIPLLVHRSIMQAVVVDQHIPQLLQREMGLMEVVLVV